MKAYRHKALAILSALYGFLLSSDRATLMAFSANERLGDVFAQTSVLSIALLVGACSLGAAVSSLFAGKLCDKIGFLAVIRLSGFLWSLASLGTYFSPQNVYIVLCKVSKGFGAGLASVAVPLYVFDVLMAPHRASAIGWAAVFSVVGQGALFGAGVLLRVVIGSPADAFHYLWIVEIGWGVLLLSSSLFLPESPKFLARRGEWDKATTYLERLARQKDMPLSSVPVQAGRFAGLFAKSVRSRFFFAVAIQLFARASCICGVTHVIHYTFAFCGLEDSVVEALYAAFLGLQFFYAALSVFVMKSARRKDMLAYGFFLLTVAYLTLGSASYAYATASPRFFMNSPVVQVTLVPASTILALTAFAFSVASLLVTSSALSFTLESLPGDARSKGASIALSAAWTVETLAASLSVGLANIHPFVLFFVLSAFSFIGLFVSLFIHEEFNPDEGLPFPLEVLENEQMENEDNAEEVRGNATEALMENGPPHSDVASGPPSLHRNSFQPQNFISIHKRTEEDQTELPQFVVTEPPLVTTARSEFTDSQMLTANTVLENAHNTHNTGFLTADRPVTQPEGDKLGLVPFRTLDSKVTISGLWSEVSDAEHQEPIY